MIQVTYSARSRLRRLLDRRKKAGSLLRLLPSPDGQIGLIFSQQREGDQVVDQDGLKLLVISRRIASVLDGAIIDCEQEQEGERLTLSFPCRDDDQPEAS